MAEPQKFANFINGQWKEPQGGNYYPDINPADYSDIVGYFPLSTKNDVDEAIQAAHIAFKSWSHMLPAERAKYLEKFAQLLDQEKQRIGEALCREEGKTIKEAVGEPARGAVETSFFIGEGQRLEGITMPSDRKGVVSVATRVPIGVVAAISPWNFPFLTPVRKVIPAL
ncbi:MAG TPA: aldehyde dehydrogenase family protein, partial [Rectinema sp.]|nr:aldehyde dehydrogenase family protein [Rectinema sp.]